MGKKARKLAYDEDYYRESLKFNNHEIVNDNIEEIQQKFGKKIYFSDLFDIIFNITEEYELIDERIKLMEPSNFLYMDCLYIDFINSKKIRDDYVILKYIDNIYEEIQLFLEKVDNIDEYCLNDENDEIYVKIYKNLTKENIYNIFGNVINKMYVGQAI